MNKLSDNAACYIERVISGMGNAKTERTQTGITIKSPTGVKWGNGDKWGVIKVNNSHLMIQLDFPYRYFTDNDFMEASGLQPKSINQKVTGFRVWQGTPANNYKYGSIKINIYPPELAHFEENAEKYIRIIKMVAVAAVL